MSDIIYTFDPFDPAKWQLCVSCGLIHDPLVGCFGQWSYQTPPPDPTIEFLKGAVEQLVHEVRLLREEKAALEARVEALEGNVEEINWRIEPEQWKATQEEQNRPPERKIPYSRKEGGSVEFCPSCGDKTQCVWACDDCFEKYWDSDRIPAEMRRTDVGRRDWFYQQTHPED